MPERRRITVPAPAIAAPRAAANQTSKPVNGSVDEELVDVAEVVVLATGAVCAGVEELGGDGVKAGAD
jgi:hypothetical protein